MSSNVSKKAQLAKTSKVAPSLAKANGQGARQGGTPLAQPGANLSVLEAFAELAGYPSSLLAIPCHTVRRCTQCSAPARPIGKLCTRCILLSKGFHTGRRIRKGHHGQRSFWS